MMKLRALAWWMCAGLILASAAARAEEGGDASKPKKPPVVGKVTAVSADSITLELDNGQSRTWSVNAETRVKVKGKEAATIRDVKVGMYASVRGPKDGPARMILASDDKPAPGGEKKPRPDKPAE